MGGVPHLRIVDRLAAIHAALDEGSRGRHAPARRQGARDLPGAGHGEGAVRRAGDRARPRRRPGHDAVSALDGGASARGVGCGTRSGSQPEARATATFTGVLTDTRAIEPGALFVALAGERFDGHDYLDAAAAAGATGAVVRQGTPPVPGLRAFEVPDTLRAFGLLARARRRRDQRARSSRSPAPTARPAPRRCWPPCCGTRYRAHATRANLNNLVGVPLTILEAPDGHRGARGRGRRQPAGRDRPLPRDHRAVASPSSPTRWPDTSRGSARSPA